MEKDLPFKNVILFHNIKLKGYKESNNTLIPDAESTVLINLAKFDEYEHSIKELDDYYKPKQRYTVQLKFLRKTIEAFIYL